MHRQTLGVVLLISGAVTKCPGHSLIRRVR